MVSNEVKDNKALLELSYEKTPNEHVDQRSALIGLKTPCLTIVKKSHLMLDSNVKVADTI